MKRLIFLILALLVAGSAMAAQTVQVMTNGTIDLDKLPTLDFSYETDPASPVDGQIWWNETTKQLKVADVLGVYEFNATALVAWDTTPTAFTFTDVVNATTNSTYTSAPITVAGINHSAAISVSGDATAKYSINNATAVNTNGTVEAGDTVRAVVTSSASDATAVNATVTIGGVSDAYSVTTASESITYLINEDFENGVAPSGWSTSNANYAYTTNPLSGAYSLCIGAASNVAYNTVTISTTATTTSGRFLLRADSVAGGTAQACTIKRGSTNIAQINLNNSTTMTAYLIGTAPSSQATTIATSTDYAIWWELDTTYNTTGSRLRVWVTAASTTTRPETPTISITRSETLVVPDVINFFTAGGTYLVYDNFVWSESSITAAE